MSHLLDVNVLIALLDTRHRFHAAAWTWFDANRAKGWSTCPITQNGLVRILSNPAYGNSGASTSEIASLLAEFIAAPDHSFLPDDISLLDSNLLAKGALRNHYQVTDLYLLAMAIRHYGTLVTFDRKIRNSGVAGEARALVVIDP